MISINIGRNSSINEPWPDVLGVLIVFIITAMFILGLENSKVFSVLMITGVLSISGLLSVVTYLRGNIDAWMNDDLMPKGLPGVTNSLKNIFNFHFSFQSFSISDSISISITGYCVSKSFTYWWIS